MAFSEHGWGNFTLKVAGANVGHLSASLGSTGMRYSGLRNGGWRGGYGLQVKVSGLKPRNSYSGRQSRPHFARFTEFSAKGL